MASPHEHPRVTDFYTEVVLPALMQQLDEAFPEFQWRRDAQGWVATNEAHTHALLGARADRVIAHGPAPRGFLVHGGDSMLWTAYVNGGSVPRGADFVRAVTELAARAGVDASPIERKTAPDRRAELLETFFQLARSELAGDRGANARDYLERRGFPLDALDNSRLGLVPTREATRGGLLHRGYREAEIKAAGILADSRWPGRLCGAWRNEWGKIGTFWVRAIDDRVKPDRRYLYLRGASRTNLPPYGLPRHVRELVLVEGFLDYHQLAARGVANVAALGGTSTSGRLFERLSRLGVESVVLCLDNDDAGRSATARAVEHATRAGTSPAVYVVRPERLGTAEDPDALVHSQGLKGWERLVESRECGVAWRAKEIAGDIAPHSPVDHRRAAISRAAAWLGSLHPRFALEQEDAVAALAVHTGYSVDAVDRAFRARYWRRQEVDQGVPLGRTRAIEPEF